LLPVAAFWLIFLFALILISRMPAPLLNRIPPEILAACAVILVLSVVLLWRMLRERGRVLAELRTFRAMLSSVPPNAAEQRQRGLPTERIEGLRTRANALSGPPARWWDAIEGSLVYYRGIDGHPGWFVDRRGDEVLSLEDVVLPSYQVSFHHAVPSVLTALGLMATFTAILMALAGVSYDAHTPGAPVLGIEGLINGLSGKFLSSIVALILSVIHTFIEKLACERAFRREYSDLMDTFRKRFPVLRPLQVLLDIREGLAE
jgi:hypothetical protein